MSFRAGGLMQLVAYGSQDTFLTNEEYEKWKNNKLLEFEENNKLLEFDAIFDEISDDENYFYYED